MPEMQHLQYNSPMQLYSREAAEEQYRQQAAFVPNAPGNAPIPLGGNSRHFDPTKSETLKLIREQDKEDDFGKNFFEKVADAEAPNVAQQREPIWAEEARHKAERARSVTPGYHQQQYYYDDNFGIPSGPPPNYTSGPQLNNNPSDIQQWHQQRQQRSSSRDRHHAPSVLASAKGYLFGGMDFIDHSITPNQCDNNYYYYESKKEEKKEPTRPGYNYGLDYSDRVQYIDDSDRQYYQGYGPQQPKLKSRYSADPNAPINTYTVNIMESVNPVRLIGDTLSNQKISKDGYLTEEEKRTFSTAYAPPQGFKRDHVTVKPAAKPEEPICYSISAKKRSQSTQPNKNYIIKNNRRSKTPDASNNDRWVWSGNKEVNMKTLLTDEALRIVKKPEPTPEWSDKSHLKHVNWSNKLRESKIQQQEPNWARINTRRIEWEPPKRVTQKEQPYWVNRSNTTRNAWQDTANHYGNKEQNYTEAYSYQEPTQNGVTHHYVTKTTTYNSGPQNGDYQYQNQGNRYDTRENRYYNHPDYAKQTGQYSVRSTYTTTDNQFQQQNEQPKIETRTIYNYQQTQPHIKQTPGQIFCESSSTSKTENKKTESIPQPPPRTSAGNQRFYEQQRSKDIEKTTEERIIPLPAPQQQNEGTRIIQQNDYNRYYKKQTTEQHGCEADGQPIPPTRSTTIHTQKPEDFNRHSEMAEKLPLGSISNSFANAQGSFVDRQGHNIDYRRELSTSADPGRDCQLLKEEERRVVETPIEPGVISRHITTKFYKKKTVTDTSTTNQ